MWQFECLESRTRRLPPRRFGAILEARFRLIPPPGRRMPRRANVAEHFLDEHMRDPYEVRQHFSTGPNVAENGFFNDYYALVSPNRLPADFVFEVVQVYAIDGQRVAGRNKIRYLPGSVMLYVQGAQGGFRPMGRSRGNEGAPRIERPRLFTPGR